MPCAHIMPLGVRLCERMDAARAAWYHRWGFAVSACVGGVVGLPRLSARPARLPRTGMPNPGLLDA